MSQFLDDYLPPSVIGAATSLGETFAHTNEEFMTLLGLSHTAGEHGLYLSMAEGLGAADLGVGTYSMRVLMKNTGLSTYGAIRRACVGLVEKLSIESQNGSTDPNQGTMRYRIFQPKEIFLRRIAAGVAPYPKELADLVDSAIFKMIGNKVMSHPELSRREVFVALLCAEGLSNAAIGNRLSINEKTVKYHLRHVFIKLGIKRRAELFSCVLKQ